MFGGVVGEYFVIPAIGVTLGPLLSGASPPLRTRLFQLALERVGHLGSRHRLLAALPKRIDSSSDLEQLRARLRKMFVAGLYCK